MKKRVVLITFLLLAILLCVCIVAALQNTARAVASGDLCEGISWSLDDSGLLTISGAGAIPDNTAHDTEETSHFWGSEAKTVTSINIKSGITAIGEYAFSDCTNVVTVNASESVAEISPNAFWGCNSLRSVSIPGCADMFVRVLPISVLEIENRDVSAWAEMLTEAYIYNDAKAYNSLVKDGAPVDLAVSIITDACQEFDYNAFLFMDSLIKEARGGDLAEKLRMYDESSKKTRLKAFLSGTWEWVDEQEEHTLVEIQVSEDDSKCVGFIVQMGTSLGWYRYTVGEVYWWNFQFEEENLVDVMNRTRTTGGVSYENHATPFIYMESNRMMLELGKSNDPRTTLSTKSRTWVKITD